VDREKGEYMKKKQCKHKWHLYPTPTPPEGCYGDWKYAVAICEKCLEKRYI